MRSSCTDATEAPSSLGTGHTNLSTSDLCYSGFGQYGNVLHVGSALYTSAQSASFPPRAVHSHIVCSCVSLKPAAGQEAAKKDTEYKGDDDTHAIPIWPGRSASARGTSRSFFHMAHSVRDWSE